MTDRNRERHRHAVDVLANHFVAGGWHNKDLLETGTFEAHFGHLPEVAKDEIREQVAAISQRLDEGSVQIIAANEFLEDES